MREARGLFSLHSPSLISAGTVRQRMLVTTRVIRESVSAPRSELPRRTGGGGANAECVSAKGSSRKNTIKDDIRQAARSVAIHFSR